MPSQDSESHRRIIEATVAHNLRAHIRARWPWHWSKFSPQSLRKNNHAEDLVLLQLPRKTTGRLPRLAAKSGYGIEAVPALSVAKIIVALFVWQTIPVLFLLTWLMLHPGDLQNAFTPLAVTTTIFVLHLEVARVFNMEVAK